MDEDESIGDWARDAFGEARLGDPRRTERLVAMAAAVARNPAGKVTQVFATSAAKEGAFRLLENEAVRGDQVSGAVFDATARRCAEDELIFVAVDPTTLTLTDRKKVRDLGRVGPRFPTRGLHVMNALAVDAQGAAKGLLEQCWWARPRKLRTKKHRCFRVNPRKKETRYWLDALSLSEQRLREQAPKCRAWYQLDRGADAWAVFELAIAQQLLITVRSAHPRRLLKEDGSTAYLRQTVRNQRILGHYSVSVPARPSRRARVARLAVRACAVVINARVGNHRRLTLALKAVLAEEVGYRGKDRVRWLLLTTAPAKTFAQARSVIAGYTLRWRVEDFHRAWKRGLCRVEDNQLHSRGAILKWATILAAVAARALRLAKLIRTTPDIPASEEFTEYEIDAAFILLKKKRDRRRSLVFSEVVDFIAEIGGFSNKYAKKYNLPGPTVLGRGLERVRILALGLKNMAEM